ncbi:unnamed protein product, partial [Ectocarpus sp. 8 AP-2014]
ACVGLCLSWSPSHCVKSFMSFVDVLAQVVRGTTTVSDVTSVPPQVVSLFASHR